MNLIVKKWGNSLAVRFPSVVVKELDVRVGTNCSYNLERGGMFVLPVKRSKKKKMTFEDFMAGITDDNLPEKISWGPPVGKEIW